METIRDGMSSERKLEAKKKIIFSRLSLHKYQEQKEFVVGGKRKTYDRIFTNGTHEKSQVVCLRTK